jgi:hypothetical protein
MAMKALSYRFHHPPQTLRGAGVQLDNLALVPANLLPFKGRYQAIANALPRGQVLIILPSTPGPQRKALEKVTTLLEENGHPVTTLSAAQFRP